MSPEDCFLFDYHSFWCCCRRCATSGSECAVTNEVSYLRSQSVANVWRFFLEIFKSSGAKNAFMRFCVKYQKLKQEFLFEIPSCKNQDKMLKQKNWDFFQNFCFKTQVFYSVLTVFRRWDYHTTTWQPVQIHWWWNFVVIRSRNSSGSSALVWGSLGPWFLVSPRLRRSLVSAIVNVWRAFTRILTNDLRSTAARARKFKFCFCWIDTFSPSFSSLFWWRFLLCGMCLRTSLYGHRKCNDKGRARTHQHRRRRPSSCSRSNEVETAPRRRVTVRLASLARTAGLFTWNYSTHCCMLQDFHGGSDRSFHRHCTGRRDSRAWRYFHSRHCRWSRR